MSLCVYLRPVAMVPSPQLVLGQAIRLAGGLTFISHIALVVRDERGIVSHEIVATRDVESALKALPVELHDDAGRQWHNLQSTRNSLICGSRTIHLAQPQVMGILNITPDSFSDGGEHFSNPDKAASDGAAMLEAGAALIDVGGESTRPGAQFVWEGDETERIVPVIRTLASAGAAVSVDTRRSYVMEAALAAGASMVNDVSALGYDASSAAVVAAAGVPVILMHSPGKGHDLHADADYRHVVYDVFDYLRIRRDAALAAGILPDRIMLDPGIGFGKTLSENLALVNALSLFHALGHPLVLGVSRKRMIGALANTNTPNQRVPGSLALALAGLDAGVQILRVHDVPETIQAVRVWRGMRDQNLSDYSAIPV